MSDTLDIIINDGRWASENPILDLKRKPEPGALHVVTVGENIPARLWFYDGPEGAASLASVRKNGVTIGLFGKLVRKDGETLLFGTTVFSELQDARGDYGYSCSLDLLTDELKNAFNQGFDGTAYVDIRINGVRVHQFKLPIRPRTYAGTELDTHPAAEGILEEMQAAAANADADAASANAAKVAAEAARDEAVAAKDIAVTKAGEASTSASNAATSESNASTSETNAATSESNAAASASDAAASAAAAAASAAKLPANPLFAKSDEVVVGADIRMGMPGGVEIAPGGSIDASTVVLSGDFTFVMECQFPSGAIGYILRSGNTPAYIHLANDGTGLQYTSGPPLVGGVTIPRGRMISLAFVRQGTVLNVYVDGTYAGQFSGVSTGDWFGFGATIGHSSVALPWRLRSFRPYNRVLTAGELLSVAKGEVPAGLAREGYSITSYALRVPTSGSISGNVITLGGSGLSSPLLVATRALYKGQVMRISYTNSAPVYGNFLSYGGSTILSYSYANQLMPAGTHVLDYELATDTDATNGYIHFADEAGASAGNTVTINSIKFIGGDDAFEPDQVTAASRWIGKRGRSLIPLSGVVALDPKPVQWREIVCVYDAVAMTTTVPPPAGWSVTRPGLGVVRLTPPSYFTATANNVSANATLASYTAGNSGYRISSFFDTSYLTAVTFDSSGTPADTIVAFGGKYFE